MAKRISTEAYQALRDALAVVTWYKTPFESFLRKPHCATNPNCWQV